MICAERKEVSDEQLAAAVLWRALPFVYGPLMIAPAALTAKARLERYAKRIGTYNGGRDPRTQRRLIEH
jgi:hypothetical protein